MAHTGPGISHYLQAGTVKAEEMTKVEAEASESSEPGLSKREAAAGSGGGAPLASTDAKAEGPGTKDEVKPTPKKEEPEDAAMPPAPRHLPDPSEVLTAENFRELGLAQLKEELDKWGSPVLYLRAMYPTQEAKEAFAQQLLLTFPKRPDLVYASRGFVPANLVDQYVLHLSDLSFDEASSKPPPFLVTCTALLDEYLTNTFITEGALGSIHRLVLLITFIDHTYWFSICTRVGSP